MSLARSNKPTEKETKENIDLLIEDNFKGIADDAKNSLRNKIFKIITETQEKLDKAYKEIDNIETESPRLRNR